MNCAGVMGAGLAKQIKEKYPEVYREYKIYCSKHDIKEQMLGVTQYIKCHDGKIIANLFGQLGYGIYKPQTVYGALKNCLEILKQRVGQYNETIAIPYNIGCGLAGGDWNIVYSIIEEVFQDYDVTLYRWEV